MLFVLIDRCDFFTFGLNEICNLFAFVYIGE